MRGNIRKQRNYLLLPGGLPSIVELSQLQVAEDHLDGRGSVAVRARVHDGHLHLPEVALDLLARVVGGIIEENKRVLLPARRLFVELPSQVAHEEHEGVLLGGGVAQREVDSAVRVQGSNHREGWTDGSNWLRTWRVGFTPDLSGEVRLVDPGLVYVDDALARLEQRQHRQRVLLPEDEASL